MMKIALLPGMNCSASIWTPLKEALSSEAHVSSHTLIPGTTVSEVAEAVNPLLDPGTVLVGHSFGGVVGMELVSKYPKKYAGLVLINAPVDTADPTTSSLAVPSMTGAEYQKVLVGNLDRLFQEQNRQNPEFLELRFQSGTEYGVERFAAHTRAVRARPDRSDFLAQTDIPVLVLSSLDDPVVPNDQVRAWVKGSTAQYRELTESKHMAILEEAQLINDEILAWIKATVTEGQDEEHISNPATL